MRQSKRVKRGKLKAAEFMAFPCLDYSKTGKNLTHDRK
jgi:hypothetical protein